MGIPTLEVSQTLTHTRGGDVSQLEDLARSVSAALNTYPHYVVVNGYPAIDDRTNLINLAKAIGAISSHKASSGFRGQPKENVSFTKIQINPVKAKAGGGVTQYSRTHLPLPLHTDSSYMARPHELVAFQCIVPEPAGGKSILLPVRDLLPRLNHDSLERLRAPVYPFGKHPYPILLGGPGNEQIRYYRAQIDRILAAGDYPLPDSHRAAIEILDAALQQTDQFMQFQLQAGQIVLMHNQKVLHGRTGFSPESDRLLYRVRLHVDSLAATETTQTLNPTAISAAVRPKSQTHDPSGLIHSQDEPQLVLRLNPVSQTNASLLQANNPDRASLEQAKTHLAAAEELEQLCRFDDALNHYQRASQLAPHNAAIFKAFGKLLLRTGRFREATHVFHRCLDINPEDYDSGLALSSLAHAYGDEAAAQAILKQVAQQRPFVFTHKPDPQKPTLLRIRGLDGSAYGIVQQPDKTYKYLLQGGHFSIRDLVDKTHYNVLILNTFDNNIDDLQDIPHFDLLLNTIACPDRKRASLLAVARFVDRYPNLPLINDPRQVLATTRERNALRLNMISGVKFPKTEKLGWDGVSLDKVVREISGMGFTFPIIVRRVGSQTGSSVALVSDEIELRAHFQKSPVGCGYYIIQFQDCRHRHSVFNKIRVFFIDGQWYPVANLFHDSWNVHSGDRYQLMDKTPWTQHEEMAFLNAPVRYLGDENVEKLEKIRDIVGLDFFGLDFTILPDGALFIFELNAAMRHNFDHAKNFPYTKQHLQRISHAFDSMVQRRLQDG